MKQRRRKGELAKVALPMITEGIAIHEAARVLETQPGQISRLVLAEVCRVVPGYADTKASHRNIVAQYLISVVMPREMQKAKEEAAKDVERCPWPDRVCPFRGKRGSSHVG